MQIIKKISANIIVAIGFAGLGIFLFTSSPILADENDGSGKDTTAEFPVDETINKFIKEPSKEQGKFIAKRSLNKLSNKFGTRAWGSVIERSTVAKVFGMAFEVSDFLLLFLDPVVVPDTKFELDQIEQIKAEYNFDWDQFLDSVRNPSLPNLRIPEEVYNGPEIKAATSPTDNISLPFVPNLLGSSDPNIKIDPALLGQGKTNLKTPTALAARPASKAVATRAAPPLDIEASATAEPADSAKPDPASVPPPAASGLTVDEALGVANEALGVANSILGVFGAYSGGRTSGVTPVAPPPRATVQQKPLPTFVPAPKQPASTITGLP